MGVSAVVETAEWYMATKTGQATGLLLSNWVRCIGGRYIQNQACEGLKKSVKRLMESNPGILRVVINIGPEIKRFPAVIQDYNGKKSNTAYLTKWAAFDFLMLSGGNAPVMLTVIQAITDDGRVIQKAFINKECVRTGDPMNPADQFWNDMRHASSRMGFEEFWSSLTGATIPYRGFLQHRTKGVLYTSEENLHVCILAEDLSEMPEMQDQLDIERLENMLAECDIPVEDYIKENMSEATIMQILKQLSGAGQSASSEEIVKKEALFSAGTGASSGRMTGRAEIPAARV